MGRSRLEVDRNSRVVEKVGHAIAAAGTALELVVAGEPGECLVAAGSGHEVVSARTEHELYAGEGVRAGAGRGALANARERHFDSRIRARTETDEVGSATSIHGVVA